MREKLEIKNLDELYKAILTLETLEECRLFFKDLCTIPELKSFSQRFQVARMLTDDHVYSDIVKATGASTATISRVNRSLSYDGSGGYNIVFERLDKLEKGEEQTEEKKD
ncbi:MAG: TrpR-like protein, YerC/YecD [Ruminococcus sp.]|nr:TrpR-like protein, YerC/YecD [Ruminococcus sp.]